MINLLLICWKHYFLMDVCLFVLKSLRLELWESSISQSIYNDDFQTNHEISERVHHTVQKVECWRRMKCPIDAINCTSGTKENIIFKERWYRHKCKCIMLKFFAYPTLLGSWGQSSELARIQQPWSSWGPRDSDSLMVLEIWTHDFLIDSPDH